MTPKDLKALALLVSGLFLCHLLPGQTSLRCTAEAMVAHAAITGLDPDDARAGILHLRRQDPGNAITGFLEVEEAFARCLVSESPGDPDRFSDLAEQMVTRISAVPKDEPWRGFCLGEIHIMNGVVAWKNRDLLSAAMQIRQGYLALREGLADFPDFLPAQRDLVLLNILITTLPDRYQWAFERIGGIDRNIRGGLDRLRSIRLALTEQGHFLAGDSGLLEILVLQHVLDHPEEALALARQILPADPDRPVPLIILTSLMAAQGANDDALGLLARWTDRPSFPYLVYVEGRCRLNRLDTPGARAAFRQFLTGWTGRTLRADALEKLAWCDLLDGDPDGYRHHIAAARELDAEIPDQGPPARTVARSGSLPHTGLLRARLLFDGGYPDKAGEVLNGIRPGDLNGIDPMVEYYYRNGRIDQATGRIPEAAKALETAWTLGRGRTSPYACAAALQMGHLRLATGQRIEAFSWYRRCLDESPADHRDRLHQKARAALAEAGE